MSKIKCSANSVLNNLQIVSADGTVIYSEVRSFLKKQPTMILKFKSITISQKNYVVYGTSACWLMTFLTLLRDVAKGQFQNMQKNFT